MGNNRNRSSKQTNQNIGGGVSNTNSGSFIVGGGGGDSNHGYHNNNIVVNHSHKNNSSAATISPPVVVVPVEAQQQRHLVRRMPYHTAEEIELHGTLHYVDVDGTRCFLAFFRKLAVCSVFSIFLGLLAGMFVSVHFFEVQRPVPGTSKMSLRHAEILTYVQPITKAKRRGVTSLDPSMASSNTIRRRSIRHNRKYDPSIELRKVITTTSGQIQVLMVVEEEHDEEMATKYSSSSRLNSTDRTTSGDAVHGHHGVIYEDQHLTFPQLSQPKILPSPCRSDNGKTIGFDNWDKLSKAVLEVNALSAERFMKWQQWFVTYQHAFRAFDDDRFYYDDKIVLTICPRTKLRAPSRSSYLTSHNSPPAIYINAENVLLECDGCVLSGGGTHLSFGSFAKNVLVRGVTFEHASTSSLTFFQDGADVTFEDCLWSDNKGSTTKFGSVADVNSTSIVNFFRCEIAVTTDSIGSSSSSLSIRGSAS